MSTKKVIYTTVVGHSYAKQAEANQNKPDSIKTCMIDRILFVARPKITPLKANFSKAGITSWAKENPKPTQINVKTI
ncbi:hypothetical protein L596_002454 [Steinernema carpocapsae]|uniref:Uncharacterized protein n=1 Tax=Steinernema carpocapsae TaxID=34508 RepID=A0A4U8UPJ8_STECR|nr:hypothetical protein L596_002454 [Steinernema carpocapsae]